MYESCSMPSQVASVYESCSVPLQVANLIVVLLSFLVTTVLTIIIIRYTRRRNKENSYSHKGNYKIDIIKYDKEEAEIVVWPDDSHEFDDRLIKFPYRIILTSVLGGIKEAKFFYCHKYSGNRPIIRDLSDAYIGEYRSKTLFKRREKKKKFKKYANQWEYVIKDKLRPYKVIRWGGESGRDFSVSRFMLYIAMEDFTSNVDLWYISFTLFRSREIVKGTQGKEYYDGDSDYKYYSFGGIKIVSPRAIPLNHKEYIARDEQSKENLDTLSKLNEINESLTRKEMKQYIEILKEFKSVRI